MKKGIAVGIIALFIVSIVSPMVIGFSLKEDSQVSVLEEIPGIEWSRTYGSHGTDFGNSVRITTDGGYILVGDTMSFSPDGWESGFLLKTDSFGNIEWYNTYGETGPLNIDVAYSVEQTTDGGYIFTGNTLSYDAKGSDLWLVKTDSSGNEEWNKIFGDGENDHGYWVKQAFDGGYTAAGYTMSYGAGGIDIWLLKTDSDGNEVWNRTFGGDKMDKGWCVDTTTDGGYIITGDTKSYGVGKCDAWLIKTDADGIEEWNRTFGGPGTFTGPNSVMQTTDGGYILCGHVAPELENYSALLIKTDSNGYEIWNKTYGETSKDYIGYEAQQTIDGGYIIVGDIEDEDSFLIKTDSNGNKEWEILFEEDFTQEISSVQQTKEGGYILGGWRNGVRPSDTSPDFWLVKVGHVPEVTITKPKNALYFFNFGLFPLLFMPRIIGPINIKVNASDDEYDIEKVEFYIDDELQETDTTEPYSWKWNTISPFSKHTLKAVAYNSNGNVGIEEKVVRKFL